MPESSRSRVEECTRLFVQELQSYIEQVQVLQDLLIKPLLQEKLVPEVTNHPFVPVFLSLHAQIVQLESQLVHSLRSYTLSSHLSPRLSTLFSRHAVLFASFKPFARFRAPSHEFLVSLDSKSFKQLITPICEDSENTKSQLIALLSLPLSHFPSYRRFVSQLSQLQPENTEWKPIDTLLRNTLLDVGSAESFHKDLEILSQLQNRFSGSSSVALYSPERKLLKEGEMLKLSRAMPIRYTFHLCSDLLLYSKKNKTKFELHRRVPLNTCAVRSVPDRWPHKHLIEISSPSKSFIVSALTDSDKQIWLREMERAIRICKATSSDGENASANANADLAPVWTPNSHSGCELCRRSFGIVVRRHHCRACGALVCSECSQAKAVLENLSKSKAQRVCKHCSCRLSSVPSLHSLPPMPGHANNSDNNSRTPKMRGNNLQTHIVQELIHTEKSYLQNLDTAVQLFAEPLLYSVLYGSTTPTNVLLDLPEPRSALLLPTSRVKGDLSVFLAQLLPIRFLSSQLLSSLQLYTSNNGDGDFDCSKVIQEFVHCSQLLSLTYAQYVGRYASAAQQLGNRDFDEFRVETEKLARCQGQTLFSLLINPIQRIPRYILFLQQLQESNAERNKSLQHALQSLEKCALHLNSAVREHEEMEKLRDLERLFVRHVRLVRHGRVLLHSGVLHKENRTGNSDPYHFMLFNDMLLYASQGRLGSLELHRILSLDSLSVTDDSSLCFFVHSATKSFKARADSPRLKQEWMSVLGEALAKRPVYAGEGFQAPVWRPDDSRAECVDCRVVFGVMTRRHHCRACGDLFCSKCVGYLRMIPSLSVSPVKVCRNCNALPEFV